MDEVKTVFPEKDALEYRDMSELKNFLPLFARQFSNADVEIAFLVSEKQIVRVK